MPSAAILAGGQARRFGGRDKSALVVNGRTILARQIEELSRVCDDIMIVTAGPVGPACARDFAGPHSPAGVRLIDDRMPGCGPLGGLDAALAAARDPELVLVACDMPFVNARLVAHLLSLAPGADAVVPRTERGYHPLCAVYSRACAGAVRLALAEGRLAMTELLERIRVRDVQGEEIDRFGTGRQLLANINTPAEFEALEALPAHKP